jgi:hypothetical protein
MADHERGNDGRKKPASPHGRMLMTQHTQKTTRKAENHSGTDEKLTVSTSCAFTEQKVEPNRRARINFETKVL